MAATASKAEQIEISFENKHGLDRYPPEVLERFDRFDKKNPGVYSEFCILAKQLWKAGKRQYGSHCLLALIRYNHDISTQGTEVFKVTNDFSPIYARKFIIEHPQYEGFFKFKTVTSKGRGSAEERKRRAALNA